MAAYGHDDKVAHGTASTIAEDAPASIVAKESLATHTLQAQMLGVPPSVWHEVTAQINCAVVFNKLSPTISSKHGSFKKCVRPTQRCRSKSDCGLPRDVGNPVQQTMQPQKYNPAAPET